VSILWWYPWHYEKECAFKEPQDDHNVPHLKRGFGQSFSGTSSAKPPQPNSSCGIENQVRIRREVKNEVVGVASRKRGYDQDGKSVFEGNGSEGSPEGPSGREESSIRKESLASDFAQDTRLTDRNSDNVAHTTERD